MKKFIIKNENLWPIFRTLIGSKLAISANTSTENISNTGKIKKFRDILLLIIYMPMDIIKIFSKYNYIILTASDDYKNIEGRYVNRLTNTFFENIQHGKILNIMRTSQNSKIKNQIFSDDTVIDYMSIRILVKFISMFINFKHESLLISYELKKNGIDMEIKEINLQICNYIALKYLYNLIFKITQPKVLLTTCYGNYQVVNVANSLGITTVEFQHGIIINHFAYSVLTDINNNFYPNYLVVFGEQDKNYLKDKFYVKDKNHIYYAGNMMIDYYKSKNNYEIINLKVSYEYVISVSLQWTVLEEMISYVVKQAIKYKNICFILIPRKKSDLCSYKENIDNIKVFDEINCYEIVANSDYHMTVYSTCAVESLSLGVCNIFLNINGLSEKYFYDFIKNNTFNFLLETDKDIYNILKKIPKTDKDTVANSNTKYIALSYLENLLYFIDNFLNSRNILYTTTEDKNDHNY